MHPHAESAHIIVKISKSFKLRKPIDLISLDSTIRKLQFEPRAPLHSIQSKLAVELLGQDLDDFKTHGLRILPVEVLRNPDSVIQARQGKLARFEPDKTYADLPLAMVGKGIFQSV